MTRFDLQYPLVTRCSALCALCVLSVCALSAVCSVCSVCFVCGGDDCWDRLHNIYADSDKKFKLLGELLGELLRKKSLLVTVRETSRNSRLRLYNSQQILFLYYTV